MDLSLEHRLLRLLDREEDGEERTMRDLRALAVDQRVLEGECIAGVEFVARAGEELRFRAAENLSKFREGDALVVGDGHDFDGAVPLVLDSIDVASGELLLRADRYARGDLSRLQAGASYCIDRRPLGLRGRLQGVVRAAFADPRIAALLAGELAPVVDAERTGRARTALASTGLDRAQLEAASAAIGGDTVTLVQGPPGTGKTRMLAELLRALVDRGCRIVLSAYTHRAVDNVLAALGRLGPRAPVWKIGHRGDQTALRAAGVRAYGGRPPALPERGVIGGTAYAMTRLVDRGDRAHLAVFDEAGQMPVPHALAGMLLAPRWVLVGDHQQLPPVFTVEHVDREVARSIFELLHAHHGGHLLDTTYRMNDGVCGVVGEMFYGGALRSADVAAGRRLPFTPGGRLDDVLDPERPAVLARVDHLQPGNRSIEEANLVADLVEDLLRQHGLPGEQVAVLAPFRGQVRLIRDRLRERALPGGDGVVVDTIERMQGQEREAVLVSMACGDPDGLGRRADFFYSTNRINVALSRARTKAVLVASDSAFRALPLDPASLVAASTFKRLRQRLHEVDLSAVYGPAGLAARER